MPGKEWSIPQVANKSLIIFVRTPALGRVKTRLARDVGPEKALSLYRAFVVQVVGAARRWREQDPGRSPGCQPDQHPACRILIAHTPEGGGSAVRAWLGDDLDYLPQAGRDLGERMANAMASAFELGADQAVLVGSDIPDLEAGHISEAFSALAKADAVLGPSADGGYWLVGGKKDRFRARLFEKMAWGSDRVFRDTVSRAQALGLTLAPLAQLQDVDTAADLEKTRFCQQSNRPG